MAMFRTPCSLFTSATLPSSTFSPRAIMHTESQMRSALSITCVLKITVLPRCLRSITVSLSALRVDRIQPAEGLVQNHQIRISAAAPQ